MFIFGLSMEQLYMYVLLAAGAMTVLYVFFGDIANHGKPLPKLDPAVILTFITFGSAIGFLMETATEFNEWTVLAIAAGVAAVLALLLYYFILLPLSTADSSIGYSEDPLPGQTAKVIIPIPVDGYGEVVLENCAGMISKRATGYDNESIGQDAKVWIVEVNNGILYVQTSKPLTCLKK